MIGHQTEGVQGPVEAPGHPGEDLEEHLPIAVCAINVLLPVTPRRDMVQRARELQPKGLAMNERVGDGAQNARPDPVGKVELASMVIRTDAR